MEGEEVGVQRDEEVIQKGHQEDYCRNKRVGGLKRDGEVSQSTGRMAGGRRNDSLENCAENCVESCVEAGKLVGGRKAGRLKRKVEDMQVGRLECVAS